MTFLNLLNEKLVVSRTAIVENDKTAFTTITAEYGNIQRMEEEKAIGLGGMPGKTFRLYLDENADIQLGDILRDTNSYDYKVIGINTPAELGAFVHLECVIEKINI